MVLSFEILPKSLLRRKARAFFDARAPRTDDMRLGLKNVYVFFSRQGLLFGALLVATFVTGINYGNNLVLGLFFYLFAIWLIAVFYVFGQVSSLSIKLVETSLSETGTLAWVTVQLTSRHKINHQLTLEFDNPAHVISKMLTGGDVDDFDAHRITKIPMLRGQTLVRLPVYAQRRGAILLPRLTISSTYPLGVMRAWSYVHFKSPMLVYPRAQKTEHQDGRVWSADDDGGVVSKVGQEDFGQLDVYREGESLGRVSWAHMAKGMGMLTKHFADPMGKNTHLNYDDMPSPHHETKLSELVFLVKQMDKEGMPFVLTLPSGQGKQGVGADFVKESLIRLAKEP